MQRFSQLYLERGKPERDSVRFRNRLAAYHDEKLYERFDFKCRQAFERETGTPISSSARFSDVYRRGVLRDVLDAITITYRVLVDARWDHFARSWLAFVERVMHEENVGYRVDSECVVHFHVDQEFEANRAAALSVLEAPALGAVRAEFEGAYRYLDSDPPDPKAAVRAMFEAIETLAKLIVPGADRLTRNLCVQKLKEACLAVASPESTEREVLGNLFSSLGYWVDSVHDYRHGQRATEPVAPSEETAVLILSTGAAFLRQLAIFSSRMDLAPISAK